GEIQRKFWRRKHFKNIRHVRQHLKQYVFEHRLKQQQNIGANHIKHKVYQALIPVEWRLCYDETKNIPSLISATKCFDL
ncbi:MAG: hypothetical protein LBC74_02640, partial [Planctomycetaceae bacterium]|nr:hypothetical protein [Planctomycetaceae bacterium]